MAKRRKNEPAETTTGEPKKIAKKDHVLHQNEHHFEIKAGDDVSHVPEKFHETLRTEGVL